MHKLFLDKHSIFLTFPSSFDRISFSFYTIRIISFDKQLFADPGFFADSFSVFSMPLQKFFLGTVIFIFLEVPASAFALIFMDFVPLSVIFFKFLHPEKLFAPMEMIFFQ